MSFLFLTGLKRSPHPAVAVPELLDLLAHVVDGADEVLGVVALQRAVGGQGAVELAQQTLVVRGHFPSRNRSGGRGR